MTHEKDKEGQSKYYLSYPKPPVIDMKWKNHDINVAEWAKHSKLSSSTEWRLRENVVLRSMECLTPAVKFDIFLTISHLFICLPTLEFIILEQQVCLTTQMLYIGNKQLQKNGTWQLWTGHIKQKSCVTLTVVS